MTPVRHPEDGRWGVLLSVEWYRSQGMTADDPAYGYVVGRGTESACHVANWGTGTLNKKVADALRDSEFDPSRPFEFAWTPDGCAFFYVVVDAVAPQ